MRVSQFAIRGEIYFSILQRLEVGWRGWANVSTCTKRKLTLGKIHFFVVEKYVEDIKQNEKHVPDLLEGIERPTCLVKKSYGQFCST